jgi:plasmid stability protein
MKKVQVYLPKDELDALRRTAACSGRSVSDLVREVIRKTLLKSDMSGPVALWSGQPKRFSFEHDTVSDEL